jgi:CBS domain-containing protein
MSARTVMLPKPVTVADGANLGQALDVLYQHRIKTAPVVDAAGRYRGLFGIHSLVRHLLPRAATLDGASLTDLAFVHDTLDTVKERLQGSLTEPVLLFADRDLLPVKPDDSLVETLLLLHRHRHTLPVVDPANERLLGIVTYWGVLAKLTGRPA